MNKLKAIAIYVEIAEQGSMSAAARSLGVVNSVVSKNLSELESWLGKKLVFRSTRNLRLTQDGVTYLDQCRKILDEVAWLEAKSKEQDKVISGHLRLTAPAYLGHKTLAPAIASFREDHPNVTLDVSISDDFRDMVEAGFDVALRVSQMPDSGFIAKKISQVRLLTVAAPGYLSTSGTPMIPRELQEHSCILENSTNQQQLWRFASRKKSQSNVQVKGPIAASTGLMAKELCLQGLGVAQLPDFMVKKDLKRGALVELLEEYALKSFYVHLLYHQNATGNLALRKLVDHLQSSLSREMKSI